MKTALFLLGVLADRLCERADESRQIEVRWRERAEELAASLPEPAGRTVEQWEELVSMEGELYYSIAAAGNARSAARQVEALRDAVGEQERMKAAG